MSAPDSTIPTAAHLPLGQVLAGDARQLLPTLPAASVDCVITSPPYFGLRDYGEPAQLGLELDAEAWATNLRGVCRELARVLKPTGSLWLNLGDGYSIHPREGASPKSLLLAPGRLALALAADGWIVRNQVIWHKPNAMPHSINDRLTCSYEVVYFLTRSRRYYFDLDAIRVPATSPKGRSRPSDDGYPPAGALPPGRPQNRNGQLRQVHSHPLGKNPGDVWSIGTAGNGLAHFASFPVNLVERPLKASCPERVCAACGRPWHRQPVDRSQVAPCLGQLQPGCRCSDDHAPGVVLDPFMGTGTVALAAEKHGRGWVGIELNSRYAALACERLGDWRRKQAAQTLRQPAAVLSGRSPPVGPEA